MLPWPDDARLGLFDRVTHNREFLLVHEVTSGVTYVDEDGNEEDCSDPDAEDGGERARYSCFQNAPRSQNGRLSLEGHRGWSTRNGRDRSRGGEQAGAACSVAESDVESQTAYAAVETAYKADQSFPIPEGAAETPVEARPLG